MLSVQIRLGKNMWIMWIATVADENFSYHCDKGCNWWYYVSLPAVRSAYAIHWQQVVVGWVAEGMLRYRIQRVSSVSWATRAMSYEIRADLTEGSRITRIRQLCFPLATLQNHYRRSACEWVSHISSLVLTPKGEFIATAYGRSSLLSSPQCGS